MARSIKRSPLIEMGRKLGKGGLRSTLVVSAVAAPVAFFAAPATQASAQTPQQIPLTIINTTLQNTAGGDLFAVTQSPANPKGANDSLTFSIKAATNLLNSLTGVTKPTIAVFPTVYQPNKNGKLSPLSLDFIQYSPASTDPIPLTYNGSDFSFQPGDLVTFQVYAGTSVGNMGNKLNLKSVKPDPVSYAEFIQTNPSTTPSASSFAKPYVAGSTQLYDPKGGATEYSLSVGIAAPSTPPPGYTLKNALLTVFTTDSSKAVVYQGSAAYNVNSIATFTITGLSQSTTYDYQVEAQYVDGNGNTVVSAPIASSFVTASSLQGAANLTTPTAVANSLNAATGYVDIAASFDASPTANNPGISSVSYSAVLYDSTSKVALGTIANATPGPLKFNVAEPKTGDNVALYVYTTYQYSKSDYERQISSTAISSNSSVLIFDYTSGYVANVFPTISTPTVVPITTHNLGHTIANVTFTSPGSSISSPLTGWSLTGYNVDLYSVTGKTATNPGTDTLVSSEKVDGTCPTSAGAAGSYVLGYNCEVASSTLTNNSLLLGNLNSTTEYKVVITPIFTDKTGGNIAYGQAQASNTFALSSTTPLTVPTPSNVMFKPGVDISGNANGQVTFNPSTGASPSLALRGYVIDLIDQTTNVVQTVSVGSGSTSYTFDNLDQSTSYKAQVFAVYSDGSALLISPPGSSSTVSESENNNPIAVTNLKLGADSVPGELAATWTNTPSQTTGYIAAGSYRVTLFDQAGQVSSAIVPGTTDRATFDNLSSSKSYYIEVTAYQDANASGQMGKTVTSTSISPESVVINGVTVKQTISYSNPTQSLVVGFSGVSGAQYTVKLTGDSNHSLAQTVDPTTNGTQTVTFTSLEPGIYTLHITATQNGNSYSYSQEIYVVQPPNEVQSLAVAATATTATLSWKAPNVVAANVVNGVDLAPESDYHYEITMTDGMGHTSQFSTPSLSLTVNSLTPGKTYTFSIVTVDGFGNPSTAAKLSVIAASAPTAVTNLQLSSDGNSPSGINVSFGNPSSSGGTTITGYLVTWTPEGSTTPVGSDTVPYNATATTNTYDISGNSLIPGQTYTVSVTPTYYDVSTAKNVGSPAVSSAMFTVPMIQQASSISLAPVINRPGYLTANLVTPGGAAPKSYVIDLMTDGNVVDHVVVEASQLTTAKNGDGTFSYTFGPLNSNASYSVSVTSYTGAEATGDASAPLVNSAPVSPFNINISNVSLTSNGAASPTVKVAFDGTVGTSYEVILTGTNQNTYSALLTDTSANTPLSTTFAAVRPDIYNLTIIATTPGGTKDTFSLDDQIVVERPNPVTTLSATANGPSSLSVNWGQPTPVGLNGPLAPVTGYYYVVSYKQLNVAKGTTGVAVSGSLQTTSTGATLNGLTPGGLYQISVVAYDQYGNPSTASTTTVSAVGIPGTVQDLSLTQVADGLIVHFKAPDQNSGQQLDGNYQVTYTDTSVQNATPVVVIINPVANKSGVMSYAIQSGGVPLKVGHTYSVSVAPEYLDQSNSGNLAIGTPLTVSAPIVAGPGVVTKLSASMDNGYLNLTWSPSTVGTPATQYVVTYTNTKTGVSSTSTVSGTSFTSGSKLSLGVVYDVSVVAKNNFGTSTAATTTVQELSANISDTIAQVPEVLDATGHAPKTGSVTVSWKQPTVQAGSAIEYYVVTLTDQSTNQILGANKVDASSVTSLLSTTFSGIANGKTVEASISAYTVDGGSDALVQTNSPLTVTGLPFAVSNLTATPSGTSGAVTLSWLVGGDNFSPITGYHIFYGPIGANGAVSSYKMLDAIGTNTNFTVNGLTDGVKYGFYVVAVNGNGSGEASSVVDAVSYKGFTSTRATLGPVSAIGANASATVTFAQVPNSQNPTFYTISYYDTSVSNAPVSTLEVPSSAVIASGKGAVSYLVPGLTNGHTYSFTVIAFSGFQGNNGPQGSEVIGTTQATPNVVPSAPFINTVSGGANSLTVSFSAGASAASVNSYSITAYDPNGNVAGVVTLPPTGSVGTITGLVDGTTYKVVVNEITNVGATPSAPAFGTPYSAPTVANKVAAVTPGNASATVSFQAATATDAASPVAGYEIVYGPTSTGFTSTKIVPATEVALGGNGTITDTIAGLTNGTNYTFQVEAFAGSQGNVNAETNYNPVAATPVAPPAPVAPTTQVAPTSASQLPPQGYYMVAADGGIFSFGPNLTFHGSLGDLKLNRPIVGMAGLPDASGYWLVASDGGVFAINTSVYYGSLGQSGDPNDPNGVIGIAANGTKGYWIADSKGYVYGFGNVPTITNNVAGTVNDIVSIIATPDGGGYYLIGADGGVFAFGDAVYKGSLPAMHITPNQPIVGAALTADGKGYYLVGKDGGVYAFGDAAFYGSMGGKPLNAPIVGMSIDPTNGGYNLFAADGGVFSFDPNGGNGFYGSMGGRPLNQPIVGGVTY